MTHIQFDATALQAIEQTARHYTDSQQFCGISWQFSHADKVLNAGEVGCLDVPGQTPLRADAIYRIYSMTKPIVSVLALKFVEMGKLRLGDPLQKYLPAFANLQVLLEDGTREAAASPIVIEQLFTHRAGFSYDFLPYCEVADRYRQAKLIEDGSRTLTAYVDRIATLPLASHPGKCWRYSVATDVLARVLEVISGQSLQSLLTHYIFEPLAMNDTAFSVADEKLPRLASMYGTKLLGSAEKMQKLPQDLPLINVDASHPTDPQTDFARGGHGLFSTCADYAKFIEILKNGRSTAGDTVLSPAMLDMMWQNRIPDQLLPLVAGDSRLPGYGWNLFGRVMLDTGQALSMTGHGEGGWHGAACTYFFVDRQQDLSGIVMTQYLGSAVPLADDMRNAFYQAMRFAD
ncbi:MAG: serine hydrolase domain-containing protein [Granulosicoccus sp.]